MHNFALRIFFIDETEEQKEQKKLFKKLNKK